MIETKYIKLSEKIAEGIKEGIWKERLPGVIRLSKELDADPTTILKAFRVLSEKGMVTIRGKKGTYITKPGKGKKHKVIGVVGMRTDLLHTSIEFSEMEKDAINRGYRIVGITHKNDLFMNDPHLLLKFPIDGYIFTYSTLTFELAGFLRENGVPFVSSSDPVGIPGVNWVDFDSEDALKKALMYLIKMGHKRIAFFDFYNPLQRFSERLSVVYEKTLKDAKIVFDKSLLMFGNLNNYYQNYGEDYRKVYGADCARKLIKCRNPITAIVTPAPQMCIGFVDEIRQHGLQSPEDISVITHNSPGLKNDFLTTVTEDYQKRATLAVTMLMDLIENPDQEVRHVSLESEIISRQSVLPVKPAQKAEILTK